MVRCNKSNSCAPVGRTLLLRRFRRFVELQSRLFKIRLDVPTFPKDEVSCRSSLKEFCSGLLEGDKGHLWHAATKSLGLRDRRSLSMSLFLFRKVVPSDPPCVTNYARKMCSPGDRPDEGFLAFCRKEVPRLFRVGWDRGYADSCLSSTVPIRACREVRKKDGGSRAVWVGDERGHHEFVLRSLALETEPALAASKVCSTLSSGKWRVVSVADSNMNLLRPLHSTIYNHLSRFNWLLRGEEKPKKFSEFLQVPGQVFVSGDYESATDNLNIEVQELILDLILSNATQVPKGISDLARTSQRCRLFGACGPMSGCDCGQRPFSGQLSRGQLMGNLLSFPLLCLVNYLGFKYFTGGHFPVKVNGDDIVFRAPMSVANRWMSGVRATGLTLSVGKTLVDRSFFTVNSKGFSAKSSRVDVVPMVRASALGLKSDEYQVSSLNGRYRSFLVGSWSSWQRELARTAFLRENFGLIVGSRRSVTRGLSIPASKTALVDSGLWAREVEYLRLPKGAERPLPVPPSVLEQERVPYDWKRRPLKSVSRRDRQRFRQLIGPEFVQCSWSEASLSERCEEDWKEHVLCTGISVPFRGVRFRLSRLSRLLGISSPLLSSLVRSSGPSSVERTVRTPMIWCPPVLPRLHRVLFNHGGVE